MNKKAYMYIIDVTFAIIVIAIGFVLLFFNFSMDKKPVYFTDRVSEDIIGVMTYTNINDLCINPGVSTSDGCSCPNYDTIELIICSPTTIRDVDAEILSMMSEIIETGAVPQRTVEDLIREIFVEKNIIDERRFGFSVIYTDLSGNPPLEIYNTETFVP